MVVLPSVQGLPFPRTSAVGHPCLHYGNSKAGEHENFASDKIGYNVFSRGKFRGCGIMFYVDVYLMKINRTLVKTVKELW
jgi:hypothetical protein